MFPKIMVKFLKRKLSYSSYSTVMVTFLRLMDKFLKLKIKFLNVKVTFFQFKVKFLKFMVKFLQLKSNLFSNLTSFSFSFQYLSQKQGVKNNIFCSPTVVDFFRLFKMIIPSIGMLSGNVIRLLNIDLGEYWQVETGTGAGMNVDIEFYEY